MRWACVCTEECLHQNYAYTKILLAVMPFVNSLFLSMFSEISVLDVWRKNKENQ